jgi:tetratricopeptide (TPR) repeat protein
MFKTSFLKSTKLITLFISTGYALILFSFFLTSHSYAKDYTGKPSNKKNVQTQPQLSSKEEQARAYRNQGLAFQNTGDLESARAYYQKAIELDPTFAAAHNDLGVIYEATGLSDRAEQAYLQAVKLDATFLSAYSNLALFYEGRRDLKKASIYWKKRAELGSEGDPWTAKAQRRYADIGLVVSPSPEDAKEKKIVGLMQDVARQKEAARKDNKEEARILFAKAKESYKRGDEVTALSLASNAQSLDPSNKAVIEFIDKVQRRLLTR